MFGENHTFTGGLSRLLKVGYVPDLAKFDYNSLYPSIILSWEIKSPKDLMDSMLKFLAFMLSQRQICKDLKKAAGKEKNRLKEEIEKCTDKNTKRILSDQMAKAASEEAFNDKKQSQYKVLCNSYFGSYSCVSIFPWGDLSCGERTTCTGRQCLRLMISHFTNLGYEPIVGDSFAPDTPVFLKYKDSGFIDIVPIEKLIDERQIKTDALGREYDYSKKPYYVLCRSGWVEPQYIYRHKTEKDLYEVSEGNMRVEVTEDHSLFNSDREKIKPSEITDDTQLEYYTDDIIGDSISHAYHGIDPYNMGREVAIGNVNKIPITILNSEKNVMKMFYKGFMENYIEGKEYSKSLIAGLQFMHRLF